MLSGRCTYHPDRAAVGVCVLCRTVICIECSTPIDGINYCVKCIEKMSEARRPSRFAGREIHPLSLLILAVTLAGLWLYWVGLASLLG